MKLLDLPLQRLDVVRVAVADGADGDARDEVDVLLTVLVHERAPLPARHGQPRVQREALHAGRGVAPLPLDDLPGPRAGLAHPAHLGSSPKRIERYAAMTEAASSRKSAKLGHALTSIRTSPPEAVTMQSPP